MPSLTPYPAWCDSLPSRYVVAHRGARAVRPENTLPAFAHAIELGAHVLEMDVHLSADGELMVIHDEGVERVTEGAGAVASLTASELQQLDAGYTFSPDGGNTHPWRDQGVRIPTLSEVMHEFPAIPKVIEIKPSQPAVAVALAKFLAHTASARGQTLVGCYEVEILRVFRAHGPDIPTSAGHAETRSFVLRALLGQALPTAIPYRAFTIPLRKYAIPLTHARVLRRARELGLHVQVWTINSADQMAELYRAGVQAVTTDYPDRAVDILADLQ